MDMFEEVADLVPKSRLDILMVQFRPRSRDPNRRYRAYMSWMMPKNHPNAQWGRWTWQDGYGPTAHDAIHDLDAKMMRRIDR